MKPDIRLYNADCLPAMLKMQDKQFDLAIVDPPYGIDINMNMGIKKGQKKRHIEKNWDKKIPDDEYFIQLKRVSKNQIIWGGNYFPLGVSHYIIWWEKGTPEKMSFSDGELAWTSFNRANKSYKESNITNDKIHPTQKPINLYKWLLINYAKEGDKILDTHLGSGNIALACWDLDFNLIGYEIDKEYYDVAIRRLQVYMKRPKGFFKESDIFKI